MKLMVANERAHSPVTARPHALGQPSTSLHIHNLKELIDALKNTGHAKGPAAEREPRKFGEPTSGNRLQNAVRKWETLGWRLSTSRGRISPESQLMRWHMNRTYVKHKMNTASLSAAESACSCRSNWANIDTGSKLIVSLRAVKLSRC